MNPELIFVVVVALLWGPTALWLVIRSVRGQSGRAGGRGFVGLAAPVDLAPRSRPGTGELSELVDANGYWICNGCHSLNRPVAARCYGCRQDRGSDQPTPLTPSPLTTMVPVMAAGQKARAQTRPAPASSQRAPRPKPASSRPEPASSAPTIVVAAAPSRPPAVPAVSPAVASSPAGDAGPVGVPIVVEFGGQSVCPFVRLKDDPATFYSFADPANLCHAGRADGSRSQRGLRRLVPAPRSTDRPQVVGLDQQQAVCLTRSFVGCALYLAAVHGGPAPTVTIGERVPALVPAAEAPATPMPTMAGEGPEAVGTSTRRGADSREVSAARSRKRKTVV